MWIRGGGKTLIHKMWIKNMFFFNPSLSNISNISNIITASINTDPCGYNNPDGHTGHEDNDDHESHDELEMGLWSNPHF